MKHRNLFLLASSHISVGLVGIVTALAVLRKNPFEASLPWVDRDTPLMVLLGLILLALFFSPVAVRLRLSPVWSAVALLGGLWAALRVYSSAGFAESAGIVIALGAAVTAAWLARLSPIAKDSALLWGPTLIALLGVFWLAVYRGPLPGGFWGYGFGSIAFGHMMGLGIVICFLRSKADRIRSSLWIGVSAPFVVGIFLSGSRGAVLGVVVLAVTHVSLSARQGLKALDEAKKVGLLLGLGIFPLSSSKTAIGGKFVETFTMTEEVGSMDFPFYTSGRLELWGAALSRVDTLWDAVLGKGSTVAETPSGISYPHNLFIEIFLAGGLLALVPFLAFIFVLFQKILVSFSTNATGFLALASLSGMFSMLSGDIAYNVVVFYFLGLHYGTLTRRELLYDRVSGQHLERRKT